MLRAYIDDSRNHRGKGIFALCGYIGDATKWAEFSDEWEATLHALPRLENLKTHEAYRLRDPASQFYGWTAAQRDAKLIQLAKVANKHALVSIQSIVRPEQYKEILGSIAANETVYQFSFYTIIAELLKLPGKWNINDQIEIIFDIQGDESEATIRRAFREFMSAGPPELVSRLGADPEFKDDRKVLPLQAADLLAWHVRRHVYEYDRGNKDGLESAVWTELLNLPRLTGIWDQQKLKLMAQQKLARQFKAISGPIMTLPDPSSGWGRPWK
ncbi:MAG: DUF3800 domain-containing protein [Xanthobacteraceae bacterium]|jgi:hypothetical protein